MDNEYLIFIQEYDGEVLSKQDSDILFGDTRNMGYKHYDKTKTYADDVRVFERKEIEGTAQINFEDWSNFTKGEE